MYADLKERQLSLKDVERGFELSLVGAHKDRFSSFISCYKCGLLFDVLEIKRLASSLNLSFMKASWLFHARSNRFCAFLGNRNGKFY